MIKNMHQLQVRDEFIIIFMNDGAEEFANDMTCKATVSIASKSCNRGANKYLKLAKKSGKNQVCTDIDGWEGIEAKQYAEIQQRKKKLKSLKHLQSCNNTM